MNHKTAIVPGRASSLLLLSLLLTMAYPAASISAQTPALAQLRHEYRIDYLPELDHLIHGPQFLTALVLDNAGNLLLIQGASRAEIAKYQVALRAYIARQQRTDTPSGESPKAPVRPIPAESVLWIYRPAANGSGHGQFVRLGTIPGECQTVPAANHAIGQLAVRWTPPPPMHPPIDPVAPKLHAVRLELPPRVAVPRITDIGPGIVAGMDANGDMVGSNDQTQPCLFLANRQSPVLLPLLEDTTRGFASAIYGNRIAGYCMRPVVVTHGQNTFHNTARLPVVWHLSRGADRADSASWKPELLPMPPNSETPVCGITDLGSDGTVVGWVLPVHPLRTEPCLWKPTAEGYQLQLLTDPANYQHQQGVAVQINDLSQVLIATTEQKVPFTEEAPIVTPSRIPYQHLWQNGTFLKIPVEGLYVTNGKGQLLVSLPDHRRGMPRGAVRFAILTPFIP